MKLQLLALLTLLLPACEVEASGGGSLCWSAALLFLVLAALAFFVANQHGAEISKKFEAPSAHACLTVFFEAQDSTADVELPPSTTTTDEDLHEKFRDRVPADVFARLTPGESS